MRRCANCNKMFSDTTDFCPICGSQLPPPESDASSMGQDSYSQPNSYSAPNTTYSQPNTYAQPGAYVQTVPYTPPADPVTVGEWMILLINFIPCIGPIIYLILLFVWAFGTGVKPSKKTFAKANLIILLISVGIGIIISLISVIAGLSLSELV